MSDLPDLPETLDELERMLRVAGDEDAGRNERLRQLAENIHAVAPHPTSPSREILLRLGDRWSSLLLKVLATGSYRHTELHRVVNTLSRLSPDTAISQRMLTLRLRVLERDGLVLRSVGEGNAPAVRYHLTPLGEGLVQRLQALLQWTAEQGSAIQRAQQAFDARATPAPDTLLHRVR